MNLYDKIAEINYNKKGYFMVNKPLVRKKRKVTVITPVYNAENFLEKTIESVISQSIGFNNIEYILVDDCSTDNSRAILSRYAKKHKNIFPILMKENSGSPSMPRNLGIELANSDYIIFLDADDWLDEKGIEHLYKLLEETKDNYAVGRTIKVTSDGDKIVGEYQSISKRKRISPFSIDRIFHHLGPPARMIRRSLLMEKNIRFPQMRFAEDKQFFIDVLTHCETISTTNEVIYYVNRKEENSSSFTSLTSIMEKTDTNIQVINYVKNKMLPLHVKKMILNRLYEFDCITRLFDRYHFLRSENKNEYFEKFKEILATTEDLDYDVTDMFFNPFNQAVYKLLEDEKYEEVEALINWNKREKEKKRIFVNGLPYYETTLQNSLYSLIRIPIFCSFKYGYFEDTVYKLGFGIYGEQLDEIEGLVFRNRLNPSEEYLFTLQRSNENDFEVSINANDFDLFSSTRFEVFVRYGVYKTVGIIRTEKMEYEKRNIEFYTTVNSNLGFKISKSKK